MRGRRPVGPEYADKLEGSDTAKERVKVILATMAGTCRLKEACERLGISEQRFHQLREEMMAAAVKALEPGHAPAAAAPRQGGGVAPRQGAGRNRPGHAGSKAGTSRAGKKNATASAEAPTPWQEEEHVK